MYGRKVVVDMERFRPATERDIDSVLQIMRRYYKEDGYPFVESRARDAVSCFVSDKNLGRLWVVLDEARVVGYLAVTLGFSFEYLGRDAFIDELYILQEYRGQGFGRDAIDIAETYCREHGVNALHLEVERHRERARELYHRAGFEDHDRFLMTKRLND